MTEKQENGLNILVVEDDKSIRKILQDLLIMEKHNVVSAESGEAALKLVQSKRFDVMITDLGLPGMTGWDLSQAARRHQPDIYIITISSWQGQETEKKIAECGVDVAIRKPFRFDQIIEAIDNPTLRSPAESRADKS
jgi:DNA-binding response OmpR family regulator